VLYFVFNHGNKNVGKKKKTVASEKGRAMNLCLLNDKKYFAIMHPGGTPIQKGRGCSADILKRIPKRNQDPILWAWLEIVFTPKRYQF